MGEHTRWNITLQTKNQSTALGGCTKLLFPLHPMFFNHTLAPQTKSLLSFFTWISLQCASSSHMSPHPPHTCHLLKLKLAYFVSHPFMHFFQLPFLVSFIAIYCLFKRKNLILHHFISPNFYNRMLRNLLTYFITDSTCYSIQYYIHGLTV